MSSITPILINSATVFTLVLDLYQEVHNWAVWVDGKEVSLQEWLSMPLPDPVPRHPAGGQLYARFRADFNDPLPDVDVSIVKLGVAGAKGDHCARAMLWVFVEGELAKVISPVESKNPLQADTRERTPAYVSLTV